MVLTCRYGGRASSSIVFDGIVFDLGGTGPNVLSPAKSFSLDKPSLVNPASLLPLDAVPDDPEKNKLEMLEARDMALPQIPTETPAGSLDTDSGGCN